MSNLFNNLPKS